MGSHQTTKGPFLIDPETQIYLVSLRMKELDVPTSQGYLQSVFYRHKLGCLLEVLRSLSNDNSEIAEIYQHLHTFLENF